MRAVEGYTALRFHVTAFDDFRLQGETWAQHPAHELRIRERNGDDTYVKGWPATWMFSSS